MPSNTPKWKFRIQHILNAITESRDFIGNMTYESFCTDAKTLKAVIWNLTVIGEAARHVPSHHFRAHFAGGPRVMDGSQCRYHEEVQR